MGKKAKQTTEVNTAAADQQESAFAARLALLKSHRLALTSDDMNKVLGGGKAASCFEFTQAVSDAIDAMGLGEQVAAIFAPDRNPKVIKRFIQFVHGINARDYRAIDKTTAIIIYALHLSPEGSPLTTDALHYLGAGLREGKISPETKGINRTTVGRLFGAVGLSTIPTQCSRTVGRNGFLQLAGATKGEPGKVNQCVTLNASHPLVQRFLDTMNRATESQVAQVTGEGA
jgi:hypothetical protein